MSDSYCFWLSCEAANHWLRQWSSQETTVTSEFVSIYKHILFSPEATDSMWCLFGRDTLSSTLGVGPHSKVYCCRLFALLYARLGNATLSLCSVLPSMHKYTTCASYSMCPVRRSPHLQALFYNPRPCRDVSIASTCVLAHSEQLERGKLVPWAVWFGIREIRLGGRTDPLRWGVIHCGRYLHGDAAHHLSLLGDG